MFLNIKGKLLSTDNPLIMGILNITDDSFYDGGKYTDVQNALKHTRKMIDEGADIIDIGAVSTRPFAANISKKDELHKLSQIIPKIKENFPNIPLSIDTFRADVAKKMVQDFQIDIINDISGGAMDKNMLETVAKLNVPYILTHIKGIPQNMQINPKYKNILQELFYYFGSKINKLHKLGVKDIVIDLGFGFGKTLEDNYLLLKNIDKFKIFEKPILIGISRKSLIYKLLEVSPENSLNGTTILNTISLIKNANIIRVHDVKEAKEITKIFKKI